MSIEWIEFSLTTSSGIKGAIARHDTGQGCIEPKVDCDLAAQSTHLNAQEYSLGALLTRDTERRPLANYTTNGRNAYMNIS